MVTTTKIDSGASALIAGWRKAEILQKLSAPDTLVNVTVSELEPGDSARGVRDSKMVTGAPVRVSSVRPIGDGRYRVGYMIIGRWETGWRDLDGDRTVTIDGNSARARVSA